MDATQKPPARLSNLIGYFNHEGFVIETIAGERIHQKDMGDAHLFKIKATCLTTGKRLAKERVVRFVGAQHRKEK